jgi:4-amino-4-deoxy-L-arabinose transferase-like glycosyltransferase
VLVSVAAQAMRQEDSRTLRIIFAALSLLTLFLLQAVHVGFQASDDASYLHAALGWLERFPYVGDSHWTLRHTITVPTAVALSLFGLNEFAVSLSNIAYFCAFAGVNAWFVARYLGPACSAVATLLIVTSPGFVVLATYLNPDVPELFFLCVAFWSVHAGLTRPATVMPWAVAGVALGFAIVNRQTAASFLPLLALLFVFKPIVPRSRYLVCAAASLPAIAADWIYLTLMTGNPLYRWTIDLNHDRVDRFAAAASVARDAAVLDKEGNLSINVFADPLLNLFVTQKYGLLFWLAVPAVVFAWRAKRHPARRTVLLLALLGVSVFLFVAANPRLYVVPRYFIVMAWAAAVVAAWWLTSLWDRRQGFVAAACLGGALAANVAALSVEDTNPRFIERQLLGWVRQHPGERVYTDIETLNRADFFFRFSKVPIEHLSSERAPAGATFFYSADRVARCAASSRCRDRVADFRPSPRWQVESVLEPEPTTVGRMVRAIGMDRRLPPDIAQRLLLPGGKATIYRVERTEL